MMTERFTVSIYQNYDYPNLFRQTPGQSGIWRDVRFVINNFSDPCDILVVLNRLYEDIEVMCEEAWLIVQEPPIEMFPWVAKGHSSYSQVYSPLCTHNFRRRCQPSHGSLPWHLDMTYNELKILYPSDKRRKLSWITSNKAIFPGHKDRMNFFDKLRDSNINFDLFGHGFNPIKNKYDGLGPYRYSIAIENYSGQHYWTEKVADCFLSWTMPIYYGCTNLADYFPAESFINIDINEPDVFKYIKEVIKSDLYLKNRDAIAEARRLVLDKYQLFPFIVSKMENRNIKTKKERIFYCYKRGSYRKMKRKLRSIVDLKI